MRAVWRTPRAKLGHGLTIGRLPGTGDEANRLRSAVSNAVGASTKPRLCVESKDHREATRWALQSVQGSRVALVKSLRSADFIGLML